jgi:hypothetical protein
MITFYVVLCKAFPYTSSALIEIAPTKLTVKTGLFSEKRRCWLSSRTLEGVS